MGSIIGLTSSGVKKAGVITGLTNNYVNWKTTKGELIGIRYCHVFNQGELEELVGKIDNTIKTKSFYEEGNWGIIIDLSNKLDD